MTTETAARPAERAPTRMGGATLVTLALLASVAPFATDLYLPAFPDMVVRLDTTNAGIQLSLTAFLIGAGLGQVVFGPISDRVGRRGPLLVGVVLYVLASVAAALAPSVAFLVAARLVQGITGAAGMVIGRAMISDVERGQNAARAMSMMMLVGGVAPVIAPVVGSALAEPIGWRGLLFIVAGLGAVALACSLLFLRETKPRRIATDDDGAARPSSTLRVLANRTYIANTLAFAFGFATLMAYISASPFVYQEMMGLSTLQYGLMFALNSLALVGMTAVNARLTRTVPVRRLAGIGLAANAGGIVVIVALTASGAPTMWLAAPFLVTVGSLGLVMGNLSAMALDVVRPAAGSGSALLGLLQFGLAGLVAPLVSLGGEGTALPLAITMLVATVVANVAFRFGRPAAAR
ncbi:Bcr/CflA family drug resistance efflux transporter [Kocuria polaris]|nr:Bcr/CflA family drug resistance efflux transporter [Kocuria polaris]